METLKLNDWVLVAGTHSYTHDRNSYTDYARFTPPVEFGGQSVVGIGTVELDVVRSLSGTPWDTTRITLLRGLHVPSARCNGFQLWGFPGKAEWYGYGFRGLDQSGKEIWLTHVSPKFGGHVRLQLSTDPWIEDYFEDGVRGKLVICLHPTREEVARLMTAVAVEEEDLTPSSGLSLQTPSILSVRMERQCSREGDIPFVIPSIKAPCHTHYKVFGDLSSDVPPLVMLHGGPGGGHEYLLSFADLWPRYGLPVVFYDQIGCAASTHLPHKAGDGLFWTEELFVSELNNLLDHLKLRDGPGFHLFGHSWGGMLAAAFASTRPRGLRRLVLASALASHESCLRGVKLLREQLPPDAEAAIVEADRTDDWETPAAKEVQALMGSRHVFRGKSPPAELVTAMTNLSVDATVYRTMWGLSWLTFGGSLTGWTCIPRLPQITAPTLVYNGEHDTSHDVSTVPFFELIPRVRWITFAGAGHMCHLEDDGLPEKILNTMGAFLVQT